MSVTAPAVVVGDDAEAVAVPECSELQHALAQQHLVQLVRDLAALHPGPGRVFTDSMIILTL